MRCKKVLFLKDINLKSHFNEKQVTEILEVCSNPEKLDQTSVVEFMTLFISKN